MASFGESRSYHDTSAGYFLPNDASEHQRLDVQGAAIIEMMGGKPFQTNVESIARQTSGFKAAEIGCGTGAMTRLLAQIVQQAQQNHNATSHVYGIDLSPVPQANNTPEIVEYIQADILKAADTDARLQPGTFDFVFHRMLVLGIQGWSEYIRKCFSLVKPGGRIELQDISIKWYDIHGNDVSTNWKWYHVLRRSSLKFGIDLAGPESIKQLMIESGFVDVEEKVYIWNYAAQPWEQYPDSDEIGRYSENLLVHVAREGVRKAAQNAGFNTPEDLEGLEGLEQLDEDYVRTMTRGLPKGTHSKYYVVCGRKP